MSRLTIHNLTAVRTMTSGEMKAVNGGRHGAGEMEVEHETEPNHTTTTVASAVSGMTLMPVATSHHKRRRRGRSLRS